MSTLTDAQKLDVRRWAGYAMVGDGTISDYADPVDSASLGGNTLTLAEKLDALTAQEEAVLTDTFLTNLATLEAAILTSAANLDTLEAGPWKANPTEVSQRTRLFDQWRRDMAAFLGIPPGPGLGGGGRLRLERC